MGTAVNYSLSQFFANCFFVEAGGLELSHEHALIFFAELAPTMPRHGYYYAGHLVFELPMSDCLGLQLLEIVVEQPLAQPTLHKRQLMLLPLDYLLR